MALKAALSGEEFETLAEPVREFYKKSEGDDATKAYVLDAEGVEDVGGLKSALQKTRDERDNISTQYRDTINKYKDIDPEKAREAQAKLDEIENKRLEEAGEFEEIKRRQKEAYDTELANVRTELGGKVEKTESQLRKVMIERELVSAFHDQDGIKTVTDLFVEIAAKDVSITEDFKIAIAEGKGANIADYVKNLKETDSHGIFFNADVATGSGASTQGNREGAGGARDKKASEMTDKEKSAYISAHGLAAYQAHAKKG